MFIFTNWFKYNWLIQKINYNYAKQSIPFTKGILLDIGCGEKPYKDVFQPYVIRYIGLEHPDTLHQNDNIDIYGDACDLPFDSDSFDTVCSFQVMEHVKEPNLMVKEIYRVLKPGGYVIVTTPFMWGIHEAPNDYYRFTKYGLEYLFISQGFEDIKIKTDAGYWITAGLRFNYYLNRFNRGNFLKLKSLFFGIIFFLVQALVLVLDRIDKVEDDCPSFLLIARKPYY